MSENEESAADDGAEPAPDADAGTDVDAEESAEAEGNGADAAAAAEEPEPDDELVERVAEADPEHVAREMASLRRRADAAEEALAAEEERVEELESKVKRTQADFQNYKKRMEKRREEEKRRATEELVERLLDVRDNLVRALEQDEDTDIRGGVEKTLDQFDRVLDAENVRAIEPEPGSEVDPQRHEVLLRVDSDQPEGTVNSLQRPGYEMAGKVLRPAQVTVSDGE